MRNIPLISLLGIFLTTCAQRHNDDAAVTIKKFYHYYIVEMDRTIPQIKFNQDTLQKYCTASFLKKGKDDQEGDIVLQAQDYYIEWAKNITVVPLNNKEYNTCLLGPIKHCIIVTVQKEQGKYKISDTRLIN